MYLEISGRRTHKTSRLVRELESWLANPTNIAILIVHQHGWGKEISRMINPRYLKRLHYGVDFNRTCDKLRGVMMPDDPRVKYFFDEFDFCKLQNVPVMQNGVYVTTPKFERKYEHWSRWYDDVLLRLIVANDFTYTVHHGMKAFFDTKLDFDDTIRNLGKERFDVEFMCHFNTCERDEPKVNPFKRNFLMT